jgi:hypothetical protein
VHSIAGWWDGFELWVAGLPFLPQFAVVLVGMVPISLAIAYLLDRALRGALRILGRDRADEPETTETITSDLADGARPLSGAAPGRQKETV